MRCHVAWQIGTIVSKELAGPVIYPEDGGGRFLQNISICHVRFEAFTVNKCATKIFSGGLPRRF
jgi:hypothetical protein